jgi:hypothetical protein
VERDARFERDLERLRREEGRFARVPELTVAMRLGLAAIELCEGRALVEHGFKRLSTHCRRYPRE